MYAALYVVCISKDSPSSFHHPPYLIGFTSFPEKHWVKATRRRDTFFPVYITCVWVKNFHPTSYRVELLVILGIDRRAPRSYRLIKPLWNSPWQRGTRYHRFFFPLASGLLLSRREHFSSLLFLNKCWLKHFWAKDLSLSLHLIRIHLQEKPIRWIQQCCAH